MHKENSNDYRIIRVKAGYFEGGTSEFSFVSPEFTEDRPRNSTRHPPRVFNSTLPARTRARGYIGHDILSSFPLLVRPPRTVAAPTVAGRVVFYLARFHPRQRYLRGTISDNVNIPMYTRVARLMSPIKHKSRCISASRAPRGAGSVGADVRASARCFGNEELFSKPESRHERSPGRVRVRKKYARLSVDAFASPFVAASPLSAPRRADDRCLRRSGSGYPNIERSPLPFAVPVISRKTGRRGREGFLIDSRPRGKRVLGSAAGGLLAEDLKRQRYSGEICASKGARDAYSRTPVSLLSGVRRKSATNIHRPSPRSFSSRRER